MEFKINDKTSWIIFSILILIFAFLQFGIYIHSFNFNDHSDYVYSAKMVSEGVKPYNDFFFVHPPLQLYILALPIKLFGFDYLLLRAIPLLFVFLLTFYLFRLVKNQFGNIEAILSVFFFLFNKTMLVNSTYSIGILMSLTFVIIGLYYFLGNRWLIGGIFFGLAAITRVQSWPFFLTIFIFSLFRINKKQLIITYKQGIMFLLGFVIVFLTVNLYFILFFNNYFNTVYFFHTVRGGMMIASKYVEFLKFFQIEKILFILPLLLFFFTEKKKLLIYYAVILFYVLFLVYIKILFNYYLFLLLPFLAIIISVQISEIMKRKISIRYHLNFVIVFFLLIIIIPPIVEFSRTVFSEIYGKDVKGITTLREFAEYIEKNSEPSDLIFGDGPYTSSIALLSNRRIAFNLVNTQTDIYYNNPQNLRDLIELISTSIDQQQLKFIIDRKAFSSMPHYLETIKIKCKEVMRDDEFALVLYRCY